MAKELPYFQFEPAEYLTGDISFCSLSAQGLFANLCSYYWQRSCKLTKAQFLKRINAPKELQELIDENVILIEKDNIIIKFLDMQWDKATKLSKTNSINGSKGGRPKKINQNKTENKPKQNPIKSETKGIRREEKRKENINTPMFKEFLHYAKTKKENVSVMNLKLKYDSWIENGWKDGNGKQIKNWKSKLLNTLPFIKEDTATSGAKNYGKGLNQLRN